MVLDDIPLDVFGYVVVKACKEGIEIQENLENYNGNHPAGYIDVIPWGVIVERCPKSIMQNEILYREREAYANGTLCDD